MEYERVTKQRYEDFQEWLNKCPLVVTDYQDYTNEFVITFNLEGRLMKTALFLSEYDLSTVHYLCSYYIEDNANLDESDY